MLQLYKNIKSRRIELDMTQSELAKRLGYADKSMIAKIEKGNVDLPQSKIIAFAKELQLTPSELMGWEMDDGDIGNAFSYDSLEVEIDSIKSLSPNEKNHLKAYIQLWEINRKKVDNYTKQLLAMQQMENDVALAAAHERTDIEVTEDMRKHDDDIMMGDSEWE